MTNILTQNAKMKKSQNETYDIYNFGIPAFQSDTGIKTCPNARQCATGCYARSGTYRFGNVVNAYEFRLKLTQSDTFVDVLTSEVKSKTYQAKGKGKKCLIRIHDSGDFYNIDYTRKWLKVIQSCNETEFYAYTKMIQLFEVLKSQNEIPNNLKLIYSYGGTEDSHIDTNRHRHSRVFQNEADLLEAGYIDASNNDLVAAIGPSNKIGLVYHGQKRYDKTSWSKVS